MKTWYALRSLLVALAVLGLVLGPLVVPSAGSAAAGTAGSSQIAAMDMGEDMPCCPSKHTPPCDQSCPLMTLCVVKVVFPGAIGAMPCPGLTARLLPTEEARWETRTERPPPRPPRT